MRSTPKARPLRAASVFSGAMGLDLGLEAAGIETVVACEFDSAACETIRANRPDLPVLEGDVAGFSGEDLASAAGLTVGDIDLLVGGPPCQAFSSAGKREALADERGNVILSYLRLVDEIRPRYFVMENVRGLLSSPMGAAPRGHDNVDHLATAKGGLLYFLVQEFRALGYEISFGLLNSANYGVPQKRERVVVIGSLDGRVPLPQPTHGEGRDKPWVNLRDAIGDLQQSDHEFRPLSERHTKYLKLLRGGQYWKHLPVEVQAEAMGKAYRLGGGKTGFYRRLAWDQPSPTLVTDPAMPATMLSHPDEVRPLSVREYARIQGFPDDWDFRGTLTKRYRQIGNAVPVGLGAAIGRAIVEHAAGEADASAELRDSLAYSRYRNTCDWDFIPAFEAAHTQPLTLM